MDTIFTESFETETKFILASDLFDKLLQNPGLRENDSLLEAFYEEKEIAPLGELGKVRSCINHIFEDDSNKLNEISLLDSLIKTQQLRKAVIDTLFENSLTDSLLLVDESSSIINEITGYMISQNELISALNEERQGKIDSAISLNNTVTATEYIEINEKTINAIYLDKIVNYGYNLDSTQFASVESIANQCPFSGGRSVYSARVILSILGDSTLYDDSLLCIGHGSRMAYDKLNEGNDFFVSELPNPANNNCVFSYRLPADTPGRIEIYTILGKKIDDLKLVENTNSKNYLVANLTDGIYLFRLIINGSCQSNGKMVIAR